MNRNKIKITIIAVMMLAITISLAACDLGDDDSTSQSLEEYNIDFEVDLGAMTASQDDLEEIVDELEVR